MNILLTNDDSFSAKGIKMMKTLLSKYGRVIVVAPKEVMSAKSASLTIGKGLKFEKIEDDVYSFSGTPVDCVAFALSSLDIDFDLVVSGCNHGLNTSFDTVYSGTVSACLEALTFRKKCFAISAEEKDFEEVIKHFDEVYKIIKDKLSNEYMLNINFPHGEVKSIEFAGLFYRQDYKYFTKVNDEYFAYRKEGEYSEKDKGTDWYNIDHHIVSITPLNRTCFSNKLLENILK